MQDHNRPLAGSAVLTRALGFEAGCTIINHGGEGVPASGGAQRYTPASRSGRAIALAPWRGLILPVWVDVDVEWVRWRSR